ncbi:MAG: TlpA family protein disulfide reductase [Saccharospirillaceae bacterium]|nr:TlpA family protein disulfide reductase [Saccharospirillaceae bacterium]MCD8531039.1 TlpA family protein disulfide reductase [Saccharospirillaceae bacterium]
MSNSDSPKPSDPVSGTLRSQWLRRGAELLVFLLLFIILSHWLSRHMLDAGSSAPSTTLPALNNPDATLQSTPTGRLIWPAEHERTLVYFFAPWCSICRVSMPGLNLLGHDDLRIVAVALDWETREEVEAFVSSVGFSGEVLLGNDTTAQQYQVQGYPSYYVMDRQGRIQHQDRGLSTPPGLWLRTQW